MKECYEFNAFINKATLNELKSNIELSEHTTHCKNCSDCLDSKIAELFTTQLNAIKLPKADEPQLVKRVKIASKDSAKRIKTAVAGFIVSLFAFVWFSTQETLEATGAIIFLSWILFSGGYALFLSRKKYLLDSAFVNLDKSLFEQLRQDTSFKINVIKWLGGTLLLEAIALVTAVFVKGITIASGLPIFVGLSAVYALFVIYQYLVVLPSLKNELKILQEN